MSKKGHKRSQSLTEVKEVPKSTSTGGIGLFGRQLEDVSEGDGVPCIIEDCTKWLEANALDEEGIFRIPGDAKQVRFLRDAFDKDPKLHIDFTKENVSAHSVAGLLKLYVRELPEPLLLFRFYDTFLKVGKNDDSTARTRNLRMLVHGLPKSNKNVLIYLMQFLNKLSKHSQNNKMTLTNIATCWAPNLLRCSEETYEKVMREASLVTNVVATLIENIEYMSSDKVKPIVHSSADAIPTKLVESTRNERSQTSVSAPSIGDWREVQTPDGKPYYYNVKTKETSWTNPNGEGEGQPLQRTGSAPDTQTLIASTPEVVVAPSRPQKPVQNNNYINPAKSNTLTVAQLKTMLEENGVSYDDCKTRSDFVKKVMDSYMVNLPPPLPPAPKV